MKKDKNAVLAVEDEITECANRFGVKFRAGVAAIREGAEIYTKALNKYGEEARRIFTERYPGVGFRTWQVLERIGDGKLNPNALMLPYRAAERFERMPIAVQDRIFDSGTNGFNVVSPITLQPRILPVTSLTVSAAEVLIDEKKGRVRTVEEQRKFLVERTKKTVGTPERAKMLYTVFNGYVRIGSAELDLATMKRIVAEMEAAAK